MSVELNKEFANKSIEQIRQNRDMILIEGDLIIIKLRLQDKKQHLSRKDGFRLIYLVLKVDSLVVFLDIYPKNGPLQQLDINDTEVKRLIAEFIEEGEKTNWRTISYISSSTLKNVILIIYTVICIYIL
ncbi:MAG: hypothetical protein LUC91_04470 [Prevotella sp.]|nr:hypothetical protein [Prevotella sp.]